MSKNEKILLIGLLASFLISIGITYHSTIIKKDFEVSDISISDE